MDLEGDNGEAELGKEVEVGAVDVAWSKRRLRSILVVTGLRREVSASS